MAATPIVSLSYPKTRESLEKVIKVVSTDTTAFQGAVLPKDALITGIYVIGHAVNTAVTYASLGIGSTTSANEFMTGFDIKAAATGEGYNPAGAAAVGSARPDAWPPSSKSSACAHAGRSAVDGPV